MNKKKVLIYAHYYIPDTACTGRILKELTEGMIDKFDLEIVEDKYKTQMFYCENINGVDILNIRVPEFSKINTMSRIKNILTYFFDAMIAIFKVGKQDYVFSIFQPPLLGGFLGVWGK